MLMKAVDSYLAVRRAAGYELVVPEYLLRSYARFATCRGEVSVRTASVIEWASEGKRPANPCFNGRLDGPFFHQEVRDGVCCEELGGKWYLWQRVWRRRIDVGC